MNMVVDDKMVALCQYVQTLNEVLEMTGQISKSNGLSEYTLSYFSPGGVELARYNLSYRNGKWGIAGRTFLDPLNGY